ncbi:hypothetical protein VRU48_14400 [Pedobacter sp. KR3-3]|uniref:Outer membrane protein beta-barrel domain-containing protein n=1 Tax=Pedobacter albus TaxID=3113905 RepID=A0ABU7IAC4_9SPHI|nr:hypothetical protein [Pedobacter sp. KR3-3]MEE1946312.1 hypothetical protein [Pedobacter sp. KR3-3]
MKKLILAASFLFLALAGHGQVNFYKLAAGGGFGATVSYADVRENSQSYAGYGALDYNFTPFVNAGLEVQMGKVKGGNIVTNPHNRQFVNSFMAFSVGGKVALGQFVDYSDSKFLSVVKGLYLGAGLGAIRNKMTYIVRYKPNTQAEYPPLGYKFPGEDKSTNLLVPLNLGMNFYFKDGYDRLRYVLNFNYQGNFTFGEGLDGYDDPMGTFKNNNPDFYTLFSVGLKYNFGPVGVAKRIF